MHYLAAPHGELHFALLSDWTDAADESTRRRRCAPRKSRPTGSRELNRRARTGCRRRALLLLHRRRLWSESEQQWMGWERKRGKLHELNRLLRGATDTTFVDRHGRSPRTVSGVRYVITLDADTRLPRETVASAGRQAGAPAQSPAVRRRDRPRRRGIRACCSRASRRRCPIGREGSFFQRVFSSTTGIDPYAAAVSDVYQDLFGEGSYAGKGIYDVDAFEAALAGRVPEGSLLSHDLFEGMFARAGLVSDIEVVEEFPARYDVAAARQHRWARGDWQLLPWILRAWRRCRHRWTSRRQGRLPLIGLWKMLDNLRRSLSAPACVLALLAGWLLPPHAALAVDRVRPGDHCVARAAARARCDCAAAARHLPRSHLRALASTISWLAVAQIVLAHHLSRASGVADDATRSAERLFRLFVSRRNLLEWVTAAQAQARARDSASLGVYRRMSGSVVIAARRGLRGRRGWAPARGWIALPFAAAVDCCAGHRAPDQRVAAGRRRVCRLPADERASSAPDRAAHLALLRDVRHGRRPHAAARQFPGRPAAGAWRIAPRRPTSACICCRGQPRAISAGCGTARHRRAAGSDAGDACDSCSASAATSTTGTTRATCARSSRGTSRRSTAAISPAI